MLSIIKISTELINLIDAGIENIFVATTCCLQQIF